MPDTQLQIIASGVPAGLCYTNLSADISIIAQYLRAVFSGSEINTGSSTPAASDRSKPWIRTNADGTPDGLWAYNGGYWLQQHPSATGMVVLWEGAIADIDTFDGGEAGAVTSISGPFWERATGLDAKSPIGPGTLASGTVINVGDAIGEEKHTMTAAELIGHSHPIKSSGDGGTGGDGGRILNAPESNLTNQGAETDVTGSATPTAFNVIHPCRGILFLRRTARLYRRRNG